MREKLEREVAREVVEPGRRGEGKAKMLMHPWSGLPCTKFGQFSILGQETKPLCCPVPGDTFYFFQSVNSNHQRRLSKLKMVIILSLAGHI